MDPPAIIPAISLSIVSAFVVLIFGIILMYYTKPISRRRNDSSRPRLPHLLFSPITFGPDTILHKAAGNNDVEQCARLLLDHGYDIDCRDSEGRTPLQVAAFFGAIDTVNFLADYGADVNAKDKYGRTALHLLSCVGVPDDK